MQAARSCVLSACVSLPPAQHLQRSAVLMLKMACNYCQLCMIVTHNRIAGVSFMQQVLTKNLANENKPVGYLCNSHPAVVVLGCDKIFSFTKPINYLKN